MRNLILIIPFFAFLGCGSGGGDVPCNPTGICLDDYQITCSPGPCRLAPDK